MATKAVAGPPVGRVKPRPARRRRGGRMLAGKGDGWALWVPVDQWDKMTDQERADRARRQAALLEGGRGMVS